jgi:hypothetical protein
MVSMRSYAGSKFLKLDDVRKGPVTSTIEHVEINAKFDKPVITLRSGAKVSLNKVNVGTLIGELGDDSDSWLGREVTLIAGRGPGPAGEIDMIRVVVGEGVDESEPPAKPKPPKPSTAESGGGAAMDDEIPFAPNRD